MWPIDRPPQWVDRSQELATIRVGVQALRDGGGAAVWVEGEPGIGKSSLVVEARAGTAVLGWEMGWGMADQLATREDLAAVLAECGQHEEARAALNEAVGLYEGLNARWDIRRAEGRLRAYGIRRSVRRRRGQRAASGWEALTPTEVKIAALVAAGGSTSDIATGMWLSRRTVQTHISHILTKLGAKGRVEIVREALRHGNYA
jgi:DNA-binding CsgD family transcriptional regulator